MKHLTHSKTSLDSNSEMGRHWWLGGSKTGNT